MEIVSTLKLRNNKHFLMKQKQIKVTLIKLFHSNKIKWNYINNEKNSKIVSIQRVDLSKSYSSAKVYVSAYSYLSDLYKIENIVKDLNKEVTLVKYYLGKELKLRNVPDLLFKVDEDSSKIKNLERLLDNLKVSNSTDFNE